MPDLIQHPCEERWLDTELSPVWEIGIPCMGTMDISGSNPPFCLAAGAKKDENTVCHAGVPIPLFTFRDEASGMG